MHIEKLVQNTGPTYNNVIKLSNNNWQIQKHAFILIAGTDFR